MTFSPPLGSAWTGASAPFGRPQLWCFSLKNGRYTTLLLYSIFRLNIAWVYYMYGVHRYLCNFELAENYGRVDSRCAQSKKQKNLLTSRQSSVTRSRYRTAPPPPRPLRSSAFNVLLCRKVLYTVHSTLYWMTVQDTHVRRAGLVGHC